MENKNQGNKNQQPKAAASTTTEEVIVQATTTSQKAGIDALNKASGILDTVKGAAGNVGACVGWGLAIGAGIGVMATATNVISRGGERLTDKLYGPRVEALNGK